MIQELLGSGIGGGGERKLSINGAVIEGSSSSSSSSTSSPSSSENLRCPRCDSPNTKFCYYNNYNLTQPRHFCKTCRRYWTKGGALRNVPIGGGCRKNKSASISVTSSAGKSSAGKPKTSDSAGKPSIGFDQEPVTAPPSNPILWAPPQNSSLLAFLRSTQNPNPNHNPNSVMIKEEFPMIGAPAVSGALNGQTLNLDPLNQVPIGLSGSLWRNSQQQQHQHPQTYQQPQQHNLFLGEAPNIGIHEIYQRLRSPANCYTDHSPLALGNGVSSASTPVLEPASFSAGGEPVYWNSAFSWPDLPTTNGAFP